MKKEFFFGEEKKKKNTIAIRVAFVLRSKNFNIRLLRHKYLIPQANSLSILTVIQFINT